MGEEEPLEEFVESVTSNIKSIKIKMQRLKNELPKIPLMKIKGKYDSMQPYNGYMGKSSYLKSQMPAYKICLSLALDVVDEVLHKVFVLRLTRKDAEKMVRQLENRKKMALKKLEKEQQEKGLRWMLQEIINDEVQDIAYSIAFERSIVVEKAKKNSLNLILKAFPADQLDGN